MVIPERSRRTSGLTLVEVAVVFFVIVVLAMEILPSLGRHSGRPTRIQCVNNLKQITLAMKVFAMDNNDRYPIQVSTNDGGTKEWAGSMEAYRHFQILRRNLRNPKILSCPGDKDRPPAADFPSFGPGNLSYFIEQNAVEKGPLTFFLGDRNLTLNNVVLTNGCYLVPTQQMLGWDANSLHRGAGNFSLVDGSTKQATAAMLQRSRLESRIPTNWLAIP
jgi:competence protein ComGC